MTKYSHVTGGVSDMVTDKKETDLRSVLHQRSQSVVGDSVADAPLDTDLEI